jgi:hypothetical protein
VLHPRCEFDVLRTRHQEAKRNSLRVSIRERLVRRVREKEVPPVRRKSSKCLALQSQLLRYFIPQQSTKTSRGVSQIFGTLGRDGIPAQEIFKEVQQTCRGFQVAARRFDVADQVDEWTNQLAILPKAKGVAIRVDEVRKGTEFSPLLLVMEIFELTRVSSLARGFSAQ